MYEKLREYIEESNNIVFFGGAGYLLKVVFQTFVPRMDYIISMTFSLINTSQNIF